jgi:hypothetical protein
MFVSGQHEPLFPFPRVPETVKAGFSIKGLTLRPFGFYARDLDVDFSRTPRPFLVTQILECCTRNDRREEVPQSFFWNLTVGKRIECLLNLLSPGEGTKIALTLACANPTCGQELEIALSLAEISALQEEAYTDEHVSMKVGNRQLALRRPTAGDQLRWLNSHFTDEATAVRAMIGTLLVDENGSSSSEETIVEGQATEIEQSLDEHDPLIDFQVEVHCPYCETRRLFEVDLEELSLRRLRQSQLRLLASVHRLAAHYHWSEQQIFSVPHWRRAYYLALIDGEKK